MFFTASQHEEMDRATKGTGLPGAILMIGSVAIALTIAVIFILALNGATAATAATDAQRALCITVEFQTFDARIEITASAVACHD
jgi:hypothetical protein